MIFNDINTLDDTFDQIVTNNLTSKGDHFFFFIYEL